MDSGDPSCQRGRSTMAIVRRVLALLANTIDWRSPAAIGCAAHSVPTGFFDGTLDEIQIYNRVLSASEVMQLWQR